MKRSRKSLTQAELHLETWVEPSFNDWTDEEKQFYSRRKTALTSYLTGTSLRQISKMTGIGSSTLRQLTFRCTQLLTDGTMAGWRALVPHFRVRPYARTATARPTEFGRGLSGSFKMLLQDYPELVVALAAEVLKRNPKKIFEARISAKNLHKAFLRACQKNGVPGEGYPYNTRDKGRRAIARYLQQILNENFEAGVIARDGKTAISRLSVGTGIVTEDLFNRPFDVVEADEHRLHMHGTVAIVTPKGKIYVPISRLSIVTLVERAYRCILGYSVAVRREVNSDAFIDAIKHALSKWERRKLPDGVAYPEGAGLPSGMYPHLLGACWSTLRVDNARIHVTERLVSAVRSKVGFSLDLGPVGHWEARAIQERIYLQLETLGFQRMVSSAGSNATDPHKADGVRQAIKARIDLNHLRNIVDLCIAQFNAEPSAALYSRVPLEALADATAPETGFIVRRAPADSHSSPAISIIEEIRHVRGNREGGDRPYITLDGCAYHSHVLSNAPGLIGQPVILQFDDKDMRTCTVTTKDGNSLGVLNAEAKWSKTPHTREMRRAINKAIREGYLKNVSVDIVADYQNALTQQVLNENEVHGKRKKIVPTATTLARTADVTQIPITANESPTRPPNRASTIITGGVPLGYKSKLKHSPMRR